MDLRNPITTVSRTDEEKSVWAILTSDFLCTENNYLKIGIF
jgi:hypothetical protein